MEKVPAKWEFKCHNYQIADTGDYDGYFELTNGIISLCSIDDDEDTERFLQKAANLLNKVGINLYESNYEGVQIDNYLLKDENKELRERINELENDKRVNLIKGIPEGKQPQYFAKIKGHLSDDPQYAIISKLPHRPDLWRAYGANLKITIPSTHIIEYIREII